MVIFQPPQVGTIMGSSELNRLETTASQLQPEDFLSASKTVSKQSLDLLKSIYDYTKSSENETSSSTSWNALNPFLLSTQTLISSSKTGKKKKQAFSITETPLQNLIVEDFDEDQIWEEIQLQNGLIYETLVSSVSKIIAHQNRASEIRNENEEDSDSGEELLRELEHQGHIPDDEDDDLSDSVVNVKPKKTKGYKTPSYSKSVVDDKFFNLAQMTEFVEKMEETESRERKGDSDSESEEDDDIDMFEDDDEEDEEQPDYTYADFFDPPLPGGESNNQPKPDLDENDEMDLENDDEGGMSAGKKAVRFNLKEDEEENEDEEIPEGEKIKFDESPSESEEDEATISNFEKKRRKIEKEIKAMEEDALKPKQWQLTGEVTAQTRPENSLLEEHLIYDHLNRQAPEITVKTTQKLEDIIKQRIKDQAWDDVTRKIKPIEDPFEFKKRLVLDAEKSKASLSEIYEKEYIERQKQKDGEEEEEKEPEEHQQIQKDLISLFHKLDALSNFHFTPTPVNVEIKVVSNVAAATLEEVGPMAVSDAMLLAPHEIQEPTKGEMKSKAERTATDRKRERRLKKKKQHWKRITREEKARERGIGLSSIKLAENVVKKSKKDSKSSNNDGYHNSKELKSSKAFFAKLQDQVHTHIDSVAKRKK